MVKSNLIKKKKGQAWSLDAIMAVIIFTAAVLVLFFYALNVLSPADSKLKEIFYEGNLAADLILSENDVGILTDGRVNQTKLDDFLGSYDQKKQTIGVTRDFYFTISGMTSPSYGGKLNTTTTQDFIQITRITIYNNRPSKFELYVYE